ncbi:damage-inducible protein CinA [Aquabacterium sp. NJ1]|uniref:CinA family protein n=1 Tax=Aquabacterium sp. NJ1 TaxID=1538295 RepID=UPI00052C23A0|nr:CinA family protein [Aquabacterium sp. NJ1]KGM40322.1 damage-inducible protein CinA [Aquabacterium sp. NJ1]
MNTQDTLTLVQSLAERLLARGAMMATAESCTGGLIAAACTELAGSSAWFERGFVTYSNQAKTELLGVSPALIERHGAVSEEVARAMAEGALQRAAVQVAVSVTGVAGPTGGSVDKPVGTVWIAWAARGEPSTARCCLFKGDRAAVRAQTCQAALAGLMDRLA